MSLVRIGYVPTTYHYFSDAFYSAFRAPRSLFDPRAVRPRSAIDVTIGLDAVRFAGFEFRVDRVY
jgi:hypothetical protein